MGVRGVSRSGSFAEEMGIVEYPGQVGFTLYCNVGSNGRCVATACTGLLP